jgi:hypothetical protein
VLQAFLRFVAERQPVSQVNGALLPALASTLLPQALLYARSSLRLNAQGDPPLPCIQIARLAPLGRGGSAPPLPRI